MYIRHRVSSSILLLCAALFTSAAGAVVFTVDSTIDDSFSHDATPGDGVCADAFGECPLRAAIEESNARTGLDHIYFDATGTVNVVASEGPLPSITDRLIIDGRTVPGYAGGNQNLENSPPLVYIDGSNLGGAGGSAKGLRFIGANAGASDVIAIGVVDFSTGISINNSATNVWIDLCYIGVLADGSAAGNNQGLFIGTDNNYVGRFFGGFGNVISGNLDSGIGIGVGTGNHVAGNRIGTTPNGYSARGNGIGIVMLATGNSIGAFSSSIDSGNLISGNLGAGISGLGGDTTIVANRIGINRGGASLANGGIGINLVGSGNTIGSTATNGENEIANNTDGIVIDGDNNTITGNEIGTNLGLGNSGDGIRIDDGTGNSIIDNEILNSGGDGIDLVGIDTTVQDNTIGYLDFAIGGIQNFGNDDDGIHVRSTGNTITGNSVGFSGDDGFDVEATGNTMDGNFVGVTADGENIGNGGDGFSMEASDNDVTDNFIANNALSGVVVQSTNDGCTIYRNSMFSNGNIGIDLNSDGVTPNDTGDPDTGANMLQNFPKIVSVSFDSVLDELTVQWRIDSATSNSMYSITADFYLADSGTSGEGKIYLGAMSVGAPNTIRTATFSVPTGTIGGNLVATATDNGGFGSTSEFSPSFGFGVSDLIFQNGFDFTPL